MNMRVFLFLLFLFSSASLIAFDIGIGSLKLSQICFFVFFVCCPKSILHLKRTYVKSQGITKCLFISILGFGIFSISYSVNVGLTLNLLVQLILNFVIFYSIITCFDMYPSIRLFYRKNCITLLYIFIGLTFFHWLLAFYVEDLQIHMGEGLLGGIKPDLLFGESNWHSIYCFFIYYSIYNYNKKGYVSEKKFRRVVIGMFLLLLLTLSRVVLTIFVFHLLFFKYRVFNKAFLIPFIILIVALINSPLPKMILPERYTMDIYDQSRNTRYIDSFFLIDQVDIYGKQRNGFGLGTLAFVNDDLHEIRSADTEWGTSINIMPAQVYFDLGIVGLVYFTLFFVFSLFKAKDWDNKYLIFSAVFFCCLHMPGYMNMFWLFMGIFYYQNNYLKM